MGMSRPIKKISYPILASALFGTMAFVHVITEVHRVTVELQSLFITFKVIFGLLGILYCILFYFFESSELIMISFMIIMNLYCLVFMWFAPLYEVAYFQCALGSAFLNLKKSWLFLVIFGLGFFGIVVTYNFQNELNWVTPKISKSDLIYISFIFLILSWFIQKFVIGTIRTEQDRLNRFSLIGFETTRLIHDIKGLLSSPMMIIENLKNNSNQLSAEDFENHLSILSRDFEHVRNVLLSINHLVLIGNNFTSIDIITPIQNALIILESRLTNIKITLPINRVIKANPERLKSIFFNLILNSIEAFQRQPLNDQQIKMYWDELVFIYEDNAGGLSKIGNSNSKSGLGLSIIKNDIQKMGGKINISTSNSKTLIKFEFI